ncbi:MAG: ParA family protein [Rhodopila sp.]
MLKRVCFSSPKGGCGKGTIARNLAAIAAHEGLSVATADLDPQASLTIWSRRRPKNLPPITHYRVKWEDTDALLDDTECKSTDVLMIDTPPSIETQPATFGALIAASDLIVVPCRPTFDDAESVGPYLRHLRKQGRPAIAVLNCVKPRVNIRSVKAYLMDAGELCPMEIADRTDYARAGEKGLGLIDVPNHPNADEMKAVWSHIRARLWKELVHGAA